MKEVTRVMIYEWNMKEFDWMGYKMSKDNQYSYHHAFIPKRHGGRETISNGAILCAKSSHPYIHVIESRDLDRYAYLTCILKEINEQHYMPTKEQLQRIRSCLESFESEYSGARTRKGKVLIKEIYTKRECR